MTTRRNLAYAAAAVLAVAGLGLVATAGISGASTERSAIKRSMPNGKTDVIKAMGNTKWSDIELKR